jgi:hypothetical protein
VSEKSEFRLNRIPRKSTTVDKFLIHWFYIRYNDPKIRMIDAAVESQLCKNGYVCDEAYETMLKKKQALFDEWGFPIEKNQKTAFNEGSVDFEDLQLKRSAQCWEEWKISPPSDKRKGRE